MTDISDSNGNAVLGGIAVTGATGKGAWKYSLDGTTFNSMGSALSARPCCCLPTRFLRYVPAGGDAGNAPSITYAWDQSSGTRGGRPTSAAGRRRDHGLQHGQRHGLADVAATTDNVVLTAAPAATGEHSRASSYADHRRLSAFINNGDGTTNSTDFERRCNGGRDRLDGESGATGGRGVTR